MAETPMTLRGMSEIRGFFRINQTPIYFVSPTAFNLLGIDRWVRSFFYVNYFDSFEGTHPRVFVPKHRRTTSSARSRRSATTCSRTRRCSSLSAAAARGKAVFVFFDEETPQLRSD